MQFFKKKVPFLKPEDIQELRDIEREAYMEEARVLAKQKGKTRAKQDIQVGIA